MKIRKKKKKFFFFFFFWRLGYFFFKLGKKSPKSHWERGRISAPEETKKNPGPDSLVVRASASGSEGRGFAPRPRHTKGVKNGTGSSLADARNKRVVLGRYKNAGRYLLLVMSQ